MYVLAFYILIFSYRGHTCTFHNKPSFGNFAFELLVRTVGFFWYFFLKKEREKYKVGELAKYKYTDKLKPPNFPIEIICYIVKMPAVTTKTKHQRLFSVSGVVAVITGGGA